MKTPWKWALAGILIVGAVLLYSRYNVAPRIDLPALSLTDVNGAPVNLSDLPHEKTILSFSASWCNTCIREMRDICAVRDESLRDVEVVIVSDESLDVVRRFSDRMPPGFRFLKLNGSFKDLGIYSIPTTYLLNPSQQVVKKTSGYINWKDPSTSHHLKKLMEESVIQ